MEQQRKDDEEPTQLQDLSEECLILIFSHLSEQDLLLAVGATCHSLHRLASDPILWRNLYLSRWPNASFNQESEPSTKEDWLVKYREFHLLLRCGDEFSAAPMQTLKKLIETGRLSDEPQSIAQFMIEVANIKSCAIGFILNNYGNREKREAIRREFLSRLNYRAMELDQAVGLVFSRMVMPGEAQQIEQILERMANTWYEQNKDAPDFPFATADAAFVMAFSIIMTSVDLVNPAVHTHISCNDFINNVRGVNGGGDFPRPYLEQLYARIAAQPFKTKDVQYEGPASLITKSFLFGKSSKQVIISLDIDNVLRLKILDNKETTHTITSWEIVDDKDGIQFKFESEGKSHVLAFSSVEERDNLVAALQFNQRFKESTSAQKE